MGGARTIRNVSFHVMWREGDIVKKPRFQVAIVYTVFLYRKLKKVRNYGKIKVGDFLMTKS